MSAARQLRPGLAVVPGLFGWPAWPQLIPPCNAALQLSHRYLPMLESFVAAPEVHARAAARGHGFGGAFVPLGSERIADVERLIASIRREHAPLLELADAFAAADAMLAAATTASLEPLYAELPVALRGLVELVRDRHHRPTLRVLEPLVYRSRFWRPEAQTLDLRLHADDRRPFILATPLVPEPDGLQVRVAWASGAVDALMALRTKPGDLDTLADRLELEPEQRARLERLALQPGTAVEPSQSSRCPRPRVRYLGHACVLVEGRDGAVLVDPLLPSVPGLDPPRSTLADLPDRLAAVVISHGHADHLHLETLLAVRSRCDRIFVPRAGGGLVDPSLRLMLRAIGFTDVVELESLARVELGPGLALTALPFLGEHGDLDIQAKFAPLIEVDDRRVLLAVDSRNLEPELYVALGRELGPVDMTFIGLECDGAPVSWLYGPLLSPKIQRRDDQTRRLAGSDADQAARLVDSFKTGRVLIYALGMEPWLTHLTGLAYADDARPLRETQRLIEHCSGQGRPAQRLYGHWEAAL